MSVPADPRDGAPGPVTVFGPDFPFAFDDWLAHPAGLGRIPAERHGAEVAVVGAGISGLIVAYELMKLGLRPVVYESGQLGGRLRSQPFEGADGIVAELGGMRFPESSTAFWQYADRLGLDSQPFPNPLTPAAGSTVIDLEGETHYARTLDDLPAMFREVAAAWDAALQEGARFGDLRAALRVLEAAGYRVHVADPAGTGGRNLCCGRTFLAVGQVDRAREEARRMLDAYRPFVERGLAVVLTEDRLDPAALAAAVDRALELPPPPAATIDLSGAPTSARLLAGWAAHG